MAKKYLKENLEVQYGEKSLHRRAVDEFLNPIESVINLNNKIFRFHHTGTSGQNISVGTLSNPLRNWQMGTQPISDLFEIGSGGYSIRYIGKEAATIRLDLSTAMVFDSDGWIRLQCSLNDETIQGIDKYSYRTAGIDVNLNLSLPIYIKPNETIWFKTIGKSGYLKSVITSYLVITFL